MAQVQIKCPTSGLWASIGMPADQQCLDQMELGAQSSVCGVCGETHIWSKADARLVDWAWA